MSLWQTTLQELQVLSLRIPITPTNTAYAVGQWAWKAQINKTQITSTSPKVWVKYYKNCYFVFLFMKV